MIAGTPVSRPSFGFANLAKGIPARDMPSLPVRAHHVPHPDGPGSGGDTTAECSR